MLEFFEFAGDFLINIFTRVIEFINNFLDLISTALDNISGVVSVSAGGMGAINNVISTMPSQLLWLFGAVISIVFIIAIIRVFVG